MSKRKEEERIGREGRREGGRRKTRDKVPLLKTHTYPVIHFPVRPHLLKFPKPAKIALPPPGTKCLTQQPVGDISHLSHEAGVPLVSTMCFHLLSAR